MARKKKKKAPARRRAGAKRKPAKKVSLQAKIGKKFDLIRDGWLIVKPGDEALGTEPKFYDGAGTFIANPLVQGLLGAQKFKTKKAALDFLDAEQGKEALGQLPEGSISLFQGAAVQPAKKFFAYEYYVNEKDRLARTVVRGVKGYPLAALLKKIERETDTELRDIAKNRAALEKAYLKDMAQLDKDRARISGIFDGFLKSVDEFNGKHF